MCYVAGCIAKHLALTNVQKSIKRSISHSVAGVKVSGVGFGEAIRYLQAKPINASYEGCF